MMGHRFILLCLVTLLATRPAPSAESPLVAAASDLQFALTEVNRLYAKDYGTPARISYGSSGNFMRQIRQGAPFEVFLSADEAYVRTLQAAGLTRDAGVIYAIGRIVIYSAKGSGINADPDLQGLATALQEGRLQHLAIANPAHAPYGRAAREALQTAGLWNPIQPLLVLGENASQAAGFVVSGASETGILPYSLVQAPALRHQGHFALIPARWHRPLRQRMVLLYHAGPQAEAFYRLMQTGPARAIMTKYGFTLPVAN